MENNFIEVNRPTINTENTNKINNIKEIDQLMLSKLDEYLVRYFSQDEIQYIKTGKSNNVIISKPLKASEIFFKYFPYFRSSEEGLTAEERKEPQKIYYGTAENIAINLINGNSPYYGGEHNEYKGNIATNIIIRIIEVIRQKELEGNSLILKNGFFKTDEKIPTISVGDYNVRFATKNEYLDGLPLFLGELAKTCQVIGKSGGAYGLDYLLNPNVENLVFTKNIVDGDSIKEVIVGSPSISLSKDKTKIIISAIELVNTPHEIADTLIKGISQALYEKYKNKGIKEIQVGIGARTLHDLGYDKFVDGNDGCPEYNHVRSQSATPEDIEKISKFTKNEEIAKSEKELKEKRKKTKDNNLQKNYLLGCSLNPDAEDCRSNDSVLSKNRDIRYRLSLCDESVSKSLKEQFDKEKLDLDNKYPSVFKRLEDIIKYKFHLKSNSSDGLRREYFLQ